MRNLDVTTNVHQGNVGNVRERYSPKPCIVRSVDLAVLLVVQEVVDS